MVRYVVRFVRTFHHAYDKSGLDVHHSPMILAAVGWSGILSAAGVACSR